MDYPHFLLAAGWTAYCALHSILAETGVKNWFHRSLGKYARLYRLFYSFVAILFLIPLIIFQYHMNSPLVFPKNNVLGGAAIAIALAGLAGAIWSLKKYIASPEGFKDLFFEGRKPVLQIQGLHRHVRHPLYLSTFLLIWGIFLFYPLLSIAIVDIIITVYTVVAIRFEETKLVKLYGEDYRHYQKKVPMIIPWIRSRNIDHL